MTRKIRQLQRDLRDAGFIELPGRGKGDHAVWHHPLVPMHQPTVDGQPGDDVKPYQEKQAKAAIAAAVEAARKSAESE